MKPLIALLTFGAALALGSSFALAQEEPAPRPPQSPAERAAREKEFDEAVVQARATLPVFWGRMADNAGGPDDYSLKVAYPSPQGGVEDIWLSDIKRQGTRIVGRLNQDPISLPMHAGQIAPILESQIVDWSFKEGRKRYGQYTTRVLAKDHPVESAKVMATLSDNPLPADARK